MDLFRPGRNAPCRIDSYYYQEFHAIHSFVLKLADPFFFHIVREQLRE
jgi:hypothetical protein